MASVNRSRAKVSKREQAARTKERIVDAAHRLFLTNGYDDTTIQAVADEAGVAVQTVYFRFGNKATLLAEVENRAVLGDAPSDEWRQQPWALDLLAETDPRRIIERFVDANAAIAARLAEFVAAVGPVLPMDNESMRMREEGSDDFFGAVVNRLADVGALRTDLSRDRSLDIVRVLNRLENFADLTGRRGWTTDDWRQWMTDVLVAQLLEPSPTPSSDRDAPMDVEG